MKRLKVSELISSAKDKMISAAKGAYLVDVDWLLMSVLKCDRTAYLIRQDDDISIEEGQIFDHYMNQRLSGQPLQYILNHQSFYGYDFYVDENVLIPRFETEELVEKALEIAFKYQHNQFIDLCSGSGCIGITLLLETLNSSCLFVDISSDALDIAIKNAHNQGVDMRSHFIESDLFEHVEVMAYDMIISNPPYIRKDVIESLETEVYMNEPGLALDGGVDGLEFYRNIARDSREYLKKGGHLLFEIGHDQMPEVKALMEQNGFNQVEGYIDLSGNDRMVVGRLI